MNALTILLIIGGVILSILYFGKFTCPQFGFGCSSPQPVASTPQPAPNVLNVIGLACQYGQVGSLYYVPGTLAFYNVGTINSTVRVRGTSLSLTIVNSQFTQGDVYVQLGNPYTGTVILEKTDGTQLASQTVTNATSVLFSRAAV